MNADLIILPEAEQDINKAYSWYELQRYELGEEIFKLCRSMFQFNPTYTHDVCENF